MSKTVLPKLELPPATVLAHLIARFPQIHASIWRNRFDRGLVKLSDGTTLNQDSPYRHGMTVCYQREVPFEPASDLQESIVFSDGEILVADKPHGMPVTPAGEYVERALLTRLQKSTNLTTLAPAHRLDRDTAGIVLFVANPAARAGYHRLFSEGMIERQYLAIAHVEASVNQRRWLVGARIERGNPWYTQRIVEGPSNATTDVELLELQENLGLFRLLPRTGKKHQLRIHMASIGFPIVGDCLYGIDAPQGADASPLQLLARRLAFSDPMSGTERTFTSTRTLRLASHFTITAQ